jgi:predicted transcriptional regulator
MQRGKTVLNSTSYKGVYYNSNKEFEKDKDIITASTNDDKSKQILIQKKENNHSNNNGDFLSINDSLHNNDIKILSLLNQETGFNYSFKGLVRKLNIHQQSLTRALNRLENLGLIEKSSVGYKLSKNGESINILSTKSNFEIRRKEVGGGLQEEEEAAASEPGRKKGNGYVQLLQTYVPIYIKPDEIVHALIGKWFNNLRWIGLIESETGGYTLQWINDNNRFQIILRVITEYLIIETNAISDKEKVEAMIGSYRIFEQITKVLYNKLEDLDIVIPSIINNSHNYKVSELNN